MAVQHVIATLITPAVIATEIAFVDAAVGCAMLRNVVMLVVVIKLVMMRDMMVIVSARVRDPGICSGNNVQRY